MRFLKTETCIGKQRYDADSIVDANNLYDSFLVGSDMLWCTSFTNHDHTFMLDFATNDKKKCSYATSIGYDWEKDEEAIIAGYLKQFQIIAVRELDMAIRLENLIGRKVEAVCDPTMLIKPEIWRKYARRSKLKRPTQYCLVYVDVPSGQCMKDAKEYARIKQLDVFLIGFKKLGRHYSGYQIMEAYSVEDFLSAIADAAMIFTSSYHGMLFAIYFHIPFVYYNKDVSRLESVALKLGLKERNGDTDWTCALKPIDWVEVDRLREDFRVHSDQVLENVITFLNSD